MSQRVRRLSVFAATKPMGLHLCPRSTVAHEHSRRFLAERQTGCGDPLRRRLPGLPRRQLDHRPGIARARWPMTDRLLPDGLMPGRTTPSFTHETVPNALRNAHHTTVWAELIVERGSVLFVEEDPTMAGPRHGRFITTHRPQPQTPCGTGARSRVPGPVLRRPVNQSPALAALRTVHPALLTQRFLSEALGHQSLSEQLRPTVSVSS